MSAVSYTTVTGRIGRTCRVYATTSANSLASGYHITDWTADYNDDAEIFTPMVSSSPQGIKTLIAGSYLFCYDVYLDTFSSTVGYVQCYVSKSNNALIDRSYNIWPVATQGSSQPTMYRHATAFRVSANDVYAVYFARSNGTVTLNAASPSHTTISATFLGL